MKYFICRWNYPNLIIPQNICDLSIRSAMLWNEDCFPRSSLVLLRSAEVPSIVDRKLRHCEMTCVSLLATNNPARKVRHSDRTVFTVHVHTVIVTLMFLFQFKSEMLIIASALYRSLRWHESIRRSICHHNFFLNYHSNVRLIIRNLNYILN